MRSQSVEAPSREEAIAAAKEQFGPTAKVVGVRRLRSGGVMGFFSTERFVAEVEVPDAPAAPAATDRPRGSRVIAEESVEDRLAQLADLMAPAGGGAPLSLYGPGGAPRAAAADDAPARRPQSRGAGTSARPQPVRPQTGGAFAGDLPEGLPDGLAEVLASAQAASAARRAGTTRTAASGAAAARPAREPRPAAPAAAASKAAPAVDKGVAAKPFAPARHRPTLVHDLVEDPRPEAPTEVSAGPSPFTAALARMVGNDRQVTAAVAEAVEQSLAAEQAAVAEAEIPEVEVIPEPEPEVTPEPEVVAEVEVTAEPEVIAEPEVTPEPEVIPEPEVVAEVEVVPEPEVVAEVEVTAEPEVIPEPEVVAEVEVVPEPEVVAEVEVTAEPEPEVVAPPVEVIAEPIAEVVLPVAEVAAEPVAETTEPVAIEPEVIEVVAEPVAEIVVEPVAEVIEPAVVEPVMTEVVAEPEPVAEPEFVEREFDVIRFTQLVREPVVEAVPVVVEAVPVVVEAAPVIADEPVVETTSASVPEPTDLSAEAADSLVASVFAALGGWDDDVAGTATVEPVVGQVVDTELVELAEWLSPAVEVVEFVEVPDAPLVVDTEPADEDPAARTAPLGVQDLIQQACAENAAFVPGRRAKGRHRSPDATELAEEPAPVVVPEQVDVQQVDVQRLDAQHLEAQHAAADLAPLPQEDPVISEDTTVEAPAPETTAEVATDDEVLLGDALLASALRDDTPAAGPEPERAAQPVGASASVGRTVGGPAPLPLDATAILPALALLTESGAAGIPPLLRGRPAVPPPRRSRPVASGSRPAVPTPVEPTTRPGGMRAVTGAPEGRTPGSRPAGLATVTRLTRPRPTDLSALGLTDADQLVAQLLALGLPEFLISPDFTADAAERGTYAALVRTLADRLPPAPRVPSEPGDVLLVVGPGSDALAAARSLAASLRLDPSRVQWATSGDSAGLVPEANRITTLDAAYERRRQSAGAGTVTIVAVDAPLRTGAAGSWLAHMLQVWTPAAVWAVVDSTRKLEDVVPWLDALPRTDAVMVQETEATADPAAVLSHVTAPVVAVDGARATPHRWASLLCERLEELHP